MPAALPAVVQPARRRFRVSGKVLLPLFVLVLMIAWNLIFWFMSQTSDVPLYEYSGTTGPLTVTTTGVGSDYVAGGPISSIRPGGVFGWVSELCIKSGVPGLGVTEFVRVSPGEEIIINRVETPIPAALHRCGPRTVARLVPPDAPEGYYELRRQLLLTKNGHPQPPITLPSLHIRVSP